MCCLDVDSDVDIGSEDSGSDSGGVVEESESAWTGCEHVVVFVLLHHIAIAVFLLESDGADGLGGRRVDDAS
jgi:hypothetical protein